MNDRTRTGAAQPDFEVREDATGHRHPRRPIALALVLGAALLLLAGATAIYLVLFNRSSAATSAQATKTMSDRAAPTMPQLPPPDLIRALSPEEALAANAERPLVSRADQPAKSFVMAGDQASRVRALECMAQAVYYEAASEGVDGGRAVAQVVLNRVRHPAYPNSICGVVYQGSERPTGCQFTFTCDGSLARIPVPFLWQRSRKIAEGALSGQVFAPVGHATHYHANYVVPYWSDSLDKVAVVGRHIFYRFRGGGGAIAIFKERYSGAEAIPEPPASVVIDESLQAVDGSITAIPVLRVEEDRIAPLNVAERADVASGSELEADLARGHLILGEPSKESHGRKPDRDSADTCAVGGVGTVKPLRTTINRVGVATSTC